MVLGVVVLVALLAGAFLFRNEISSIVSDITKSEEEQALERKKEERFRRKGAVGEAGVFIFGTDFFDKLKDQSFRERAQKEKEKQAKQAGFKSVTEFEQATDVNLQAGKFNPAGKIGFGIKELNQGRGIPDNPQNRALVRKILSEKRGFIDANVSSKRKTGKKRSVFR